MLEVKSQVNIQSLNTFRLASTAAHITILQDESILPNIPQHPLFKHGLIILGSGSNIIFSNTPQQWIIKNELKGIFIEKETDEHIWIRVKGGENWHSFVMYCVQHNYAGIENLSLIPGTVGASPIQNIGAYGVEVKDVITKVKCYHFADNCYYEFNNAACQFGYRESIFKSNYKNEIIVTDVTFQLHKTPSYHTAYGMIKEELERMNIQELSIQAISQAVINIRSSKLPDPSKIGNAGSFFKNPIISIDLYNTLQKSYPNMPGYKVADSSLIKIPAAYLIEQAGWKGYKEGAIGVHEKQPLVLVNYGGGEGSNIIALSERIIADITAKFCITLEREVQIY